MIPKRVIGATRVLSKPDGWEEVSNDHCSPLAIADVVRDGMEWMVSAWEPSAEELRVLVEGGTLHLWVSADVHPVVGITVDKIVDSSNN